MLESSASRELRGSDAPKFFKDLENEKTLRAGARRFFLPSTNII
jgi:hypothetical protein